MNYLAHLALSHRKSHLMMGNFIADNITRREEALLPDEILAGVILHRKIDEFTDDHPAFHRSVKKLRPHHRKYAPVVIDILNDHLLSNTWGEFYREKEQDFHQYVYQELRNIVGVLPPKANKHVQSLLDYKYLRAYGHKEGLQDVLRRMDNRTKFPSDFESGVNHLYDDYNFFEEQFRELYADLVKMVKASI